MFLISIGATKKSDNQFVTKTFLYIYLKSFVFLR